MDVRRGPKEFQMPAAWIPGTTARAFPVKGVYTAAPDGQGNHTAGTNWFDSVVGLSPGFVHSRRAAQQGACQNGDTGSTAAAGPAIDLNTYGAAVAAAAAASHSFVPAGHVYPPTRAVGSSTQGWHQVRYSEPDATATIFGNITWDGGQGSIPLLLDGRATLSTQVPNGAQSLSAARETAAPPFAPVTPDKHTGTQDGRLPGSADLVEGVQTVREGQEQASIPPTFDPKGKDPIQLHFDQGLSEQTNFWSLGLPPSQLQEIVTQEMAEKLEVNLNQTPPQKPRRKKHRPKVVREGKPARTPKPTTPTPAAPRQARAGESASGKRKYVRREVKSDWPTNPNVLGETAELHVKGTRPVRRHLHFPDEDDKVACQATGDGTKFTIVQNGQEVGVNASAGIAVSLSHSHNQILDGYLKSLETPSLPLQPSRKELIRENLKKLARIRDVTQVASQESTVRSEIQTGCQMTFGNLSSRNSASKLLSTEESMGRSERYMENDLLTDDAQLHKANTVQTDFNYEQTCNYNRMNGFSQHPRDRSNHFPCFPGTHKKRRTQKAQNGLALSDVAPFEDVQRIFECERLQAMEGKQAFGQAEIGTRKMSEVYVQTCNMESLTDNMKHDQLATAPQNFQLHDERQENGIIHRPQACLEALAADIHTKVRRKRRTKKEQVQVFSISSTPHNTHNFSGALVPYMHQNEALHPLDVIVDKMKCLNINRDQEENGIQEQYAIVPYGAHGMMVPFAGQRDPTKKSRPRAKVDLDQETNRVWKLLMGKEINDGIEGTGIDKEKWWEEERRVFRGRADSFIARMHLVQGDRRFSPWKGSVLDSVIGVFLTQNVSDHLSSSAFMALAARFPCRPREANGDKPDTFMELRTGLNVDLNVAEKSSDKQEACDHVPQAVHEAEQMGDKEIHPFGSNIEGDMFPYSKISTTPLRDSRSSTEADDRRPLDDIYSSQTSVVSSQNSSDDLVLTTDQIGSILESKSEAVDPLTAKGRSLETRTSFMELLEIAGTNNFQHLCACVNERNCETESCNSPFNILKHGWGLGEEMLSFSPVTPVENKTSNTRKSILAESATDISNPEKSALTSQSIFSGYSQPFMCNRAAPSTHTGYGNHSYDDVCSRVMTEPTTVNHFHSYSGLQEERTMEVRRKEMGSNSPARDIQICSEALSKAHNSIAHQVHLGSSYMKETSDVVECFPIADKGRTMQVQRNEMGFDSSAKNIQICSEALSKAHDSIAHQVHSGSSYLKETSDIVECFLMADNGKQIEDKAVKQNSKDEVCSSSKDAMGEGSSAPRTKRGKSEKEKAKTFDWESLRRQACQNGTRKERSSDTMDSLDWDTVRNADVSEIAYTIRERGMNNMLAERIKSFLDRLVKDHGSIDLEWLRDVPPDKAKDYLLSVRGLGLKSVECVRLLTLHHLAFPVDTNVGRICVRLGWVPLQPLPESLQLHLLELYPMLETIQKYLWPRLCTLDQRTLYELHYQMITFGKVFCTKSKPNCNACPMRGECKHFASAFASARLALPGPEEKCLVTATMEQNPQAVSNPRPLLPLEGNSIFREVRVDSNCEPIIEEPATPESECAQIPDIPDIEDGFYEDPDEIPTIKLNAKEFAQNLQNYMQQNNMELQNVDWSKALVTLTPEAASIPMPKLKNVSRLRTEHQVYELPDSHPLLEGLDQREPQDPCPYLLAIWTPGETAQSIEPPESCSNAQCTGNLCDKMTCFSCNSIREAQAQTVRGTLLIPCRTAMRGSFPLNGTYFQVNEVFADHETSLTPIDVPRAFLWNLPRRTVYFGTSIPTIFRRLAIEDIQNCFWRGFVCVRGFDRKARRPRPLMARLHFPASKVTRGKKPAAKDDQ